MRVALVAHAETWRPYGLTYVGLVGLAAGALAAPSPSPWQLLGAWGVPTLGWLAGLYGGDYFDRKLDAIAKPHRPIPSGRLPARTALAMMVICCAAGAVGALLLNWRTLGLVGLALVAGILYSTWFKARGLSGNLVRGGLTAFAFLFGTMATATLPPPYLLPVAALFWLHDASSNLVGTLRDLDGDREGGYGTVPVRHGVTVALTWAAVLYAAVLALAAAVPALVPQPRPAGWYWILLGIAAALGASALVSILRAPRPLSPRTALRAHEFFVLERLVLAAALLALGTGAGLALPLLVAVLVLTWLTQRIMRARYEFAQVAPGGEKEGMNA
ncbi:UbiA family prenyltransferase [Nonomuraea sp. NPDC001831]|uniref:UbiA family prenyltransferase n=1 Tax=Nonomuraea sp. NPDC001831 TaxID=3364340 RepID=UPI0036B8CEF4